MPFACIAAHATLMHMIGHMPSWYNKDGKYAHCVLLLVSIVDMVGRISVPPLTTVHNPYFHGLSTTTTTLYISAAVAPYHTAVFTVPLVRTIDLHNE